MGIRFPRSRSARPPGSATARARQVVRVGWARRARGRCRALRRWWRPRQRRLLPVHEDRHAPVLQCERQRRRSAHQARLQGIAVAALVEEQVGHGDVDLGQGLDDALSLGPGQGVRVEHQVHRGPAGISEQVPEFSVKAELGLQGVQDLVRLDGLAAGSRPRRSDTLRSRMAG